jgi:hypothetical protein
MLRFPHPDILRRALSGDAVPPEVRRRKAAGGRDDHAGLWLDPGIPLAGPVRAALRTLGVDIDPRGPPPPFTPLRCWHELLELRPVADAAFVPSPATPVLFELSDLALWSRLVIEMQRVATSELAPAWRETVDGKVLLRVTGPPLFSLLRTAAPDGGGPVAYVEQAPRVWVELGWAHAVAADIVPLASQVLFLRPPRQWTFLADGAFERELGELPLPARPSAAGEITAKMSLPVALRLVPGGASEPAELWVLRNRPFEQLAELLQSHDDTVLGALDIAARNDADQPVVILRARPGKHGPPVLVLDGESYRPYLKLPHLFLAVGMRLQPALRRDAIRSLFAATEANVSWLVARPGGTFVVERVPDNAFAPLLELVCYVREEAPQHLQAWAPAARFDLEPFLPRDEDVPVDWRGQFRKPAPPPVPPKPLAPLPGLLDRIGGWFQQAVNKLPRFLGAPAAVAPAGAPPAAPESRDPLAAAVQKYLQPVPRGRKARADAGPRSGDVPAGLEERFLRVAGPLDAPERLALWPKLAGAYQAEEKWADAAVCWANALWGVENPSLLWVWGWFQAEARAARWSTNPGPDVIEHALMAPLPDAADVRAIAAYAVCAAHPQSPLPALADRTGRVAEYLEANEHLLSLRGAWLAWQSMSRQAGGDLLTLARARDRLLERLFHGGLSLDQDLPGFLRYAGQDRAGRTEPIRDWLIRQREPIHRWIEALHEQQPPDPARQDRNVLTTARWQGKHPPFGSAGEAYCTRAYADLTLAYGLARLGAAGEAGQLWKQARGLLATRDLVHRFLLDAYSFRIDQVLEGRPAEGALPPALTDELQHMPELDRYKIDWLRQQSRILEPQERINPFRGDVQTEYFDQLNPVLARLPEIGDRRELKKRIEQLLAEAPQTKAGLPRILKAALDQAPRIDEAFALDLLGRVGAALDETPAAPEAAPLLEKALFVAAHFEQTVYVQQFLGRFQHLLDRKHGLASARAFASLAEQSFRGLRKLGMRDEIDRLHKQMAECILQGQSLPNLRVRMGVNIAGVLPTLLHVAGVWFYEGNDAAATAVIDEVRSLLFANRLPPADQTGLVRAYATSLGQAPAPLALERLEEIFRKVERVNDALTTRSHFSLAQLAVIEAAVLAVVDANFTLGTTVRRWLDEDEYLVRRRIHRDLKAVMAQTG